MSSINQADSQPSLVLATELLLVKDNQVLLGLKKRGFGQGKYIGVGGKVEPGESIEAAAIREMQEEILVTAKDIFEVGNFEFLFPHKPEWGHQVSIFLAHSWIGEPTETAEIDPRWFSFENIPYSQMWADAEFWLPGVLNGQRYTGRFIFDESAAVVEHTLQRVEE